MEWHLRALFTHAAIGVPQVQIDVRALASLRAGLGAEAFGAILAGLVDADSARNLDAALDAFDAGTSS